MLVGVGGDVAVLVAVAVRVLVGVLVLVAVAGGGAARRNVPATQPVRLLAVRT